MTALALLLAGGITIAVFYIIRINRRLDRDTTDREQSEQREQARNRVLQLLAHGLHGLRLEWSSI